MTSTISNIAYNDPKWSTITGLSGMTISTDSSTAPSYSIDIGGTILKTTDIDFIHALQKCSGSNQDVVIGLQNFIQKAKADWTYIPPVYTWTTTTSGTGMPKYNNTIKYAAPEKEFQNNWLIIGQKKIIVNLSGSTCNFYKIILF